MKFQILSDGAGLRSLGKKNSKNKGHHQLRAKVLLQQVRIYEPRLVWILICQNLSVSLSNILSLKLSMVSLLGCKLVVQVLLEFKNSAITQGVSIPAITQSKANPFNQISY